MPQRQKEKHENDQIAGNFVHAHTRRKRCGVLKYNEIA
jgi:hypothetical protein